MLLEDDPDDIEDLEDIERAEEGVQNSHHEIGDTVLFQESRPSDQKFDDPVDERDQHQDDLDEHMLLFKPFAEIHDLIFHDFISFW